MSQYEELVKALRCCGNPFGCNSNCPMYKRDASFCRHELINDAAAAIEALQAEVERLEPKRGEMVEVVRCKDCKHRPTGTGVNHDIEFPDAICPCQCYEDYWYSWMPSDDWYCGNGEKTEVQE